MLKLLNVLLKRYAVYTISIPRNNTNVAATETEEHVAPVRPFSDTSSTNLRSNNAAFEVREHFVPYYNR